ncbi:MAG: chemotaxis protein CheA [Spirochaetales bacterium]|nr:chemotaxis protein CheA [Spirochaetales bacterium]
MKIDLKQIVKKLDQIAMALINLEDGDLMLFSDLSDEIDDLVSNLPQIEYLFELKSILLGILSKLLKGETVDKANDLLSQGIDFIIHYVNLLEKSGDLKVKLEKGFFDSIKLFCEKHKSFEKASLQINLQNANGDEKKAVKKNKEKPSPAKESKSHSEIIIQNEAFEIFIVEASEKLIQAQDLILTLENDLDNKSILHDLFRIFHTIKGECGFLKLSTLGELTHNIENLMDLLRNGEINNNKDIINILLQGIDYSTRILQALQNGNIQILEKINIENLVDIINQQTHKVKVSLGEILKADGKLSEDDVSRILKEQKDSNFMKKFGEIAVEENLITESEIKESLNRQKVEAPTENSIKVQADALIKVKSSQINYLVDMIGELLIAENQLEEHDKNAMQLKKITRQIQEAAMRLRTTEVKTLFLKMKRVVRDLSQKLNKEIETEIIGEDLEIDRNLVETLEEPLVHILRNAAHHGIESLDERQKVNKPLEGKIIIRAERTGNSILISIKDDGRGLNKEKIISKAIEKKIITPVQAEELSDIEIHNLIFTQGFSTADEVDLVSGRGVGMDIVKTVVIGHRGRIEVRTEPGLGSEVRMLFPLSTAIIDGMIVESSGIYFIIPVSNIIESLKMEDNMVFRVKDSTEVIKLREEIIPIININDFFNRNGSDGNKRRLAVIVENNEKKKFAFIVDNIIAKKEIVIKSLGSKFEELDGISSGTVLQGGKIGFVLDVEQIVNIKGVELV